jgi:glycosyltransferase involved in cell wall biosynthesis
MRIAQIASLTERVPPRKYGGTERIVSIITEELVKRGHEVTLFASGDSVTKANHIATYPTSLRDAGITDVYTKNTLNLMNIGKAYEMQEEFDIIHDHNGILSLPTAQSSKTPVIMTLHGALNDKTIQAFTYLKKPGLISISNAQRLTAPKLNYVNTIYNGLPMYDYPFSASHDNYMLFVGRIAKEKGTHIAIKIAKKLKKKLIIAAKLDIRDQEYFDEYIQKELSSPYIEWVGEVNELQRNILMSRAEVFLHPITWSEPFGLTLIEAMACGCPVVAFNLGSIPEVIKHGKTGFVVSSEEEMVNAILDINLIEREYCSVYSKIRFNSDRMIDEYLSAYDRLILQHSLNKKEYTFIQDSYLSKNSLSL